PEPEPEPEPQPEPEEQAQPEPPPPPAPEPEPEEQTQPEPPPETPSKEEAAEQVPMPVLRKVFEFGEEATGPKVSPEGNSSTEASTEPQETEEPEAAEEEGTQSDAPEMLAGTPSEDGAAATAEAPPLSPAAEPAQAEETGVQAEVALPTLTEAQTIFSEDMTDDPVARVAMEDLPRGLRATQLCETELTEQLRNASPRLNPDFIPRSPLSEGNVLELRGTAFRADEGWLNLSFRCEVNGDATKVVSFAFDVGDPVPRSEWKRRGFPGS
ncbi:DUF930 domain-containing protein, partial [Neorhizobium sp. T786]|uniref:DUF930 domain-containing protein n=1 Tax=Pseudorhizobium xiangyangii TaxID=2883104 RepID=UPI001CFFBC51